MRNSDWSSDVCSSDLIVHGGVWTRTEPLVFTAKDGGQNGFAVRWRGADDARPLITGGMAVADWQLQDKARGIYTADVPRGTSARQLWVDGKLARRARTEIDRGRSEEHTSELQSLMRISYAGF